MSTQDGEMGLNTVAAHALDPAVAQLLPNVSAGLVA